MNIAFRWKRKKEPLKINTTVKELMKIATKSIPKPERKINNRAIKMKIEKTENSPNNNKGLTFLQTIRILRQKNMGAVNILPRSIPQITFSQQTVPISFSTA